MTESGNDLERLVGAANDGDHSALNRVLAIIRPLVVRFCRARIGRQERSSASADDVAQEVCLAVLTALPGYRDQGRPFLAFVYGIAAHKVVDAHRTVARSNTEMVDQLPDGQDVLEGPEQRVMNGALSAQMGQLLDTLPPKQREILVLRVVVGLSAEETAEAVESTPGAVRVAQHRALSKLRYLIEAQESRLARATADNVPWALDEYAEGLSFGEFPAGTVLTLPMTRNVVDIEEERSDWVAAPITGISDLDVLFDAADRRIERGLGDNEWDR